VKKTGVGQVLDRQKRQAMTSPNDSPKPCPTGCQVKIAKDAYNVGWSTKYENGSKCKLYGIWHLNNSIYSLLVC